MLESHWGIAAAVAAFSLSSLSLCLSGFGNGTHSEGMSISKLVDRPQCIGRTGVLELGRKHYLIKMLTNKMVIHKAIKTYPSWLNHVLVATF